MINQCPHCQGNIRFNPDQQGKLEQALAKLEQGQLLTLKCPHCQQSIKINKDGQSPSIGGTIQPPQPPNLDWLTSGVFQGEEKVEDVPMALVLYQPSAVCDTICSAVESVGYQVVRAETSQEAIERMRFVNFACVVYQADLEGALEQATFHRYLSKMSMERRRYIFYILIGPVFHTLYNLEAMAYSANLTVNLDDIKYLDVILHKTIPDYEELFGPIMEELGAYGKR
ncbi:hypothetical protein [Desulfogranum marinum]|jgi:hypothetical protein|uniref:hypothetical protein n=1 Tax=Desulfogranum marinum TaxID=453220 RepID=UPI0019659B6B|nr:hypothetical protein [Desulfogranum marinum]MBM9512707.1 hypothetical protein [Desulfogranum marinum]